MSIGSTTAASIAGVPLAQTGATESDRARDAGARQLRATFAAQAELAAGVGAPDGEEHGVADRDADGRRLWEAPLPAQSEADEAEGLADPPPAPAKDATGDVGQGLDLSG